MTDKTPEDQSPSQAPDVVTPEYVGTERRKTMHDRMDDVENGLKSQRYHNYGLYFATLLLVGLLTLVYSTDHSSNDSTTNKLAKDEHETCVVQARGLPAGHHLAAGLGDVVQFLQLILPPGVIATPQQQALFRGIENNLGAYSRVESKQPTSRACTTTHNGTTTTTTTTVTKSKKATTSTGTITTKKASKPQS